MTVCKSLTKISLSYSKNSSPYPLLLEGGMTPFTSKKIACGGHHTAVLSHTGRVYVYGGIRTSLFSDMRPESDALSMHGSRSEGEHVDSPERVSSWQVTALDIPDLHSDSDDEKVFHLMLWQTQHDYSERHKANFTSGGAGAGSAGSKRQASNSSTRMGSDESQDVGAKAVFRGGMNIVHPGSQLGDERYVGDISCRCERRVCAWDLCYVCVQGLLRAPCLYLMSSPGCNKGIMHVCFKHALSQLI